MKKEFLGYFWTNLMQIPLMIETITSLYWMNHNEKRNISYIIYSNTELLSTVPLFALEIKLMEHKQPMTGGAQSNKHTRARGGPYGAPPLQLSHTIGSPPLHFNFGWPPTWTFRQTNLPWKILRILDPPWQFWCILNHLCPMFLKDFAPSAQQTEEYGIFIHVFKL